MGSTGSELHLAPAYPEPPAYVRLVKRISQTAAVPLTLACVIGIAAVLLPDIGQVATHVQANAPVALVRKVQTAKPGPQNLWPEDMLGEALLRPAFTLPPATQPMPGPLQPVPAAQPPSVSAPGGERFGIGDRLKVVLYEGVADEEADKWGRSGGDTNGFMQRPEFGGEYSVDGNGGITLPLLGQFVVAGHTPKDLQNAIAASFKALTAHDGLVTIAMVERPPIYVLGPVKTPGTYKFMAGMTVFHAVALSGGFSSQNLEPWQQLEAIRENDKRRASLQALPRLLARLAVLTAERDDTKPAVSSDLLQLIGDEPADALLAKEAESRKGIAAAHQAEEDALIGGVTAAKNALQRLSNLQQPLDQLIQLRKDRVNAIQTLAKSGAASRQLVIQAQADLADAEQRREDSLNQLTGTAQNQLAAAEQALARFEAETRTTLENELIALDQQISAADGDAASSLNVLSALQPAGYAQPSDAAQIRFTIVRQSAAGPREIAATGLTALEPGDLVKIDQPNANMSTLSTASRPILPTGDAILIHDSTP